MKTKTDIQVSKIPQGTIVDEVKLNLFAIYERITIFVLRQKISMSLCAVFIKVHPDFHSMCILKLLFKK